MSGRNGRMSADAGTTELTTARYRRPVIELNDSEAKVNIERRHHIQTAMIGV